MDDELDKSIREHMEAMAAKPRKIRPIKLMTFPANIDNDFFEHVMNKKLLQELGIWDER